MSEEKTAVPGENFVGKLTIKSMGTNPGAVAAREDGRLPLARIYGRVAEVRYQEDKNNAGSFHTKFIGNFEGVNLETKVVYRSGVLYLPKGISEVMEATAKKLLAEDSKASIEFAFEIRAVKASNPIGYSYEAQALRSPDKTDELADLRKLLAGLPADGIMAAKGKVLPAAPAKK